MSDATAGEIISSNGEPGTEEAEALAAALNHSAERVQTLWFSFLTFMLYLAIATGTTTHRMLFLESPLNLPVLNIPLPLLAFYILTPVIFIVFHFYMLLNLVLLARTAKSFEDTLARAFPEDGEARETFRMRIENTLFVQLLVGGRLEREGINAKFLSLMALITLALAPVALLLMIQIKFLPYHSESITWLHRGLLALDLALVWTLWPGFRSGWGVCLWPKKTWRLVWPGVLSGVLLAYAVVVATFPDERIYLATDWLREFHVGAKVRAKITPVNTLDLHGEDLIDDAKLKQIIEKNESSTDAPRWVATLPLAERDLTGANLTEADVRHVDFSNAILNRANLDFALVNEARFDHARLQGASLDNAQLQGALLDHAQLHGASLYQAQLQGASFDQAQLQGASLNQAQLQGASLSNAELQGALLVGAHLQGASLYQARLHGASIVGAQIQGALLDHAQLQGASLHQAQLESASFLGVCAWRADARQAAWKDARVSHPETGPKADKMHECDWTAVSFAELKRFIAKEVPEGENKRAAVERIEQHLDPTKAVEGEDEMAQIWAAREREAPAPEAYTKSIAEQWHDLGCAAEGAPHVLHALIARLSSPPISSRDINALAARIANLSSLDIDVVVARLSSPDPSAIPAQSGWAKQLASDFLYENCAGALGLSEADKAKLKKIAPQRLK